MLSNFPQPRLSSLLLTMETPKGEASAGETDEGCLGAQTSGTFLSDSCFLFLLFVNLHLIIFFPLISRESRKKGGREREKHRLVASSCSFETAT